MRILVFFKLEWQQVGWQGLVLCLPGQISLEKVQHVVLCETLTLKLLFWSGYLQKNLRWNIAFKEIFLCQFSLFAALLSSLFKQCFLLHFSLSLFHLHFFNDRWCLFLEFLDHIHVHFIVFIDFLVNDLLKGPSRCRAHKVHIVAAMD